MKTPSRIAFAAAAVTLLAAAATHADGPGAYRWVDKPAGAAAPELTAIDAYNAGYVDIQRADSLQESLSGIVDRKDLRKTERDALAAYKSALKNFTLAARRDPQMHEAHTYVGYANRKLGRFDASLDAYAVALRINPDYPHAIEYQGQAFLGLNRVEEAKFNYLRLYAIAPSQAAKLLAAMQRWVEAHRSNTSLTQQVTELSAWIATRPPAAAGGQSSSSW